jgi:hypothetical protein
MQFLWFSSNVDGSVSMRFRGDPAEWSDDVKANLIHAFADLAEEIIGEEVVEYEVDAEASNVIHLKNMRECHE